MGHVRETAARVWVGQHGFDGSHVLGGSHVEGVQVGWAQGVQVGGMWGEAELQVRRAADR